MPVVQLVDGKAGFRNLEHCCSPWACSICSTIIRAHRAGELRQVVTAWTEQGHGLAFLTVTRPHTISEPLEVGLDRVQSGWRELGASQKWRTLKQVYGIRHWVRSTEITWNLSHGWHAHIHALLFLEDPDADVNGLGREIRELWSGLLSRDGGRPISRRHGVTCLPVATTPEQVASYLSKSSDGISAELMRMDAKRGRKASLSPFQLLDQETIDQLGPGTARRLWLEYVAATHGRRSVTWSRKLRGELMPTRERTDQEIIEATIGGQDVIDMPAAQYRELRQAPNLLAHVLGLVETGEIPLALDLLNTVHDE
nr:protein rep [Bifidobacterium sp. SO4]